WRLWSGGERIVCAPEAAVRHRSSATSDLLGLFNRGFLFERNAFLTAYKNYEPGLWERMMPAVMLTLASRTQALLESNPGAEMLRLDPYAGHIANTGGNGPAPIELPSATTWEGFKIRWRGYGPREFLRRGLRKLGMGAAPAASAQPRIADERTVAQLRALHWLLGNLEGAANSRAAVQARRKRSDREIFERFPLYLVPTYPGDQTLFASPGFQAWLPEDVSMVKASLDEIMEMG
ncbi:MAG TPA: hypothetical protein VIC28_00180, partial [Thermoanaerobaculia bacterium]